MASRRFTAPASSSPVESATRGRAARTFAGRGAHTDWQPGPGRADPIALLETQTGDRSQDLVPIRYGRMLSSPFAFYRGAAAIMAADLAGTPHSGIITQLCGDAHLANFGAFMTPERTHVFGLTDFDETLPGPWEWDVKRLAASFEIAGQERGFSAIERRTAVGACLRAYRDGIVHFAAMGNLALWYARLETDQVLGLMALEAKPAHVRRARADITRSRSRDHQLAMAKLTTRVDGELRFRTDPPLVVRAEDLLSGNQLAGYRATVDRFLAGYRSSLPDDLGHFLDGYRFADMARKVVGVGSVGTRCWIVLLLGRDDSDPLVLQLKEATDSVLEPYLGQSSYAHHGQRIVAGQRLMQAATDILLGWYRIAAFDGLERDFYVRQLWDGKFSPNIESMTAKLFRGYAQLCGWSLARAHARSGDRVALASYLGRGAVFERSVTQFAVAYAGQNERDFNALKAAAADGRISATIEA